MEQGTTLAPRPEGPAPAGPHPTDGAGSDDVVAVPLRHPWRWVGAALLGISFC